jgi:hypothetical protein
MTFGPQRQSSGGQRKLGHYDPVVSKAAPPLLQGAQVYASGTPIPTTTATLTVVPLDTVLLDRDAALDVANNALRLQWFDSSGDGVYEFIPRVQFAPNATGDRSVILQQYRAGVWTTFISYNVPAANSDVTDVCAPLFIRLTGAPTGATWPEVRLVIYQSSGGNLNANLGFLSVRYLASTL